MMTLGLYHFLLVGLILFVTGIYIALSRLNVIGILMGIELILNAAGLNFVAFSHYNANHIDGHIMAIFIIVLAAAEAVVALALLLSVYKRFGTVETDKVVTLKE